jgi:hypothetical protein
MTTIGGKQFRCPDCGGDIGRWEAQSKVEPTGSPGGDFFGTFKRRGIKETKR